MSEGVYNSNIHLIILSNKILVIELHRLSGVMFFT